MERNNISILSYLITSGGDLDVADCYGKTPLMVAVMGGIHGAAEVRTSQVIIFLSNTFLIILNEVDLIINSRFS